MALGAALFMVGVVGTEVHIVLLFRPSTDRHDTSDLI